MKQVMELINDVEKQIFELESYSGNHNELFMKLSILKDTVYRFSERIDEFISEQRQKALAKTILQEKFDQNDLRDLYYSRKVFAKINGVVQEARLKNNNRELPFDKDTTPCLDLREIGFF